jgi:signal peptidase I
MSNLFFWIFIISALQNYSPFLVEGNSMLPNLQANEIILIDKQVERADGLQRGDIIVFSFDQNYFYVKRVIGLPGDSIEIKKNQVKLKNQDGQYRELNEPYLHGEVFNYGDERFFKVPQGKYFVMGDNRDSSKDSRYFVDPYVDRSMIYGKYVYP